MGLWPGQDQPHVHAVVAAQLGGVLDDDADPARKLEVLEQERDAHELPIVRVACVATVLHTRSPSRERPPASRSLAIPRTSRPTS